MPRRQEEIEWTSREWSRRNHPPKGRKTLQIPWSGPAAQSQPEEDKEKGGEGVHREDEEDVGIDAKCRKEGQSARVVHGGGGGGGLQVLLGGDEMEQKRPEGPQQEDKENPGPKESHNVGPPSKGCTSQE